MVNDKFNINTAVICRYGVILSGSIVYVVLHSQTTLQSGLAT